jgi:uncharacterized membrane protein YeaQ/YmgE (transglycosylase-associated protein family)
MIFVLSWIIYGLIVGIIAKLLHPVEDAMGFLPTIAIGIAGSYIGGFLNWILGFGNSPISPSGFMMGIIGGIIFCWIYRKYKINKFIKVQGRKPLY